MVTASLPSRAVSTMPPHRPMNWWADRRTPSSLSTTRTRRPRSAGGGGRRIVEGRGLRREVFPDADDALLDLAGVGEDVPDALGDLRVVAEVALEQVARVGEDVVHGQDDLAVDRVDGLAGGAGLLGAEQIERVQRGGDGPAEDLGEVEILFAEGARLGTFDVEGADDAVGETQRHGKRAARPGGTGEVERVGERVRGEVAIAGRRHEAGDAVAIGVGVEDAVGRLGGHALLEQRVEPAALGVEEADLDDLVMQQVPRQAADIAAQQVDALVHAQLGHLHGVEGGEFAAGPVQRVELLLLEDGRRRVVTKGDEQRGPARRDATG